MPFKTKINTKIKKLFAKEKSKDLLGIALCQKSLALCAIAPKNVMRCDATNIVDNHHNTLKSLPSSHEAKGQTYLVLSPQQAQIVQVDKPNVPEEELLSALKWQIKDLVSVAPDNMLLDYYDGPNLSGVEKINVVCASLSDIKTLINPLLKPPFSLCSIITEEFAFSQLVESTSDAALLVCQQLNEEIFIIIVKEGKVFFHRRLRGFSQIAMKSEAELGMGLIDNLSLEIQRSTDYFERQLKQAPIKSIEVIVPIKNESFLARKLSENTNVAVNLLILPSGFQAFRENAASIGAVMPAYRELNPVVNKEFSIKEELVAKQEPLIQDQPKNSNVMNNKDVPTNG